MASFLSPTYVPEFNPYISTVPVELYGKVIMQKQAEYNKGLENVQSYVQNVTGLEMGREIDDAYYKQKVGELKTRMQGMLTSDFSNRDVLLQAGSYASAISNDKRIQESVMSNLHAKDYSQQLAKAQQDGTFAPENADPGISAIQSWKNGGANATLGKMNYTPYDNYMPRLQSFMKAVNPDVRIDQHSPIGADGKPIPYVLVDGKIKEVSDEKVISALNTFYSTDNGARTQRGLTTQYQAKGITDDGAKEMMLGYHNQALKSIDGQIDYNKQQAVLNASDPVKKSFYEQQVKTLTDNRMSRESNFIRDVNELAVDPLSVKASLVDRVNRQSLVNTFTYKEESQKMVENPMWTAQMDINQFNADEQQRAITNSLAQNKFQYEMQNNEVNRQHDLDKIKATAQYKTSTSGGSLSGGVDPSLPGNSGGTMLDESVTNRNESKLTQESFDKTVGDNLSRAMNQTYQMLYEGFTTTQGGSTISANANLVERVATDNGFVYRKREGVTDAQISSVLANARTAYQKDGIKGVGAGADVLRNYFGSKSADYGDGFLKKASMEAYEWESVKSTNKKSAQSDIHWSEFLPFAGPIYDLAPDLKPKTATTYKEGSLANKYIENKLTEQSRPLIQFSSSKDEKEITDKIRVMAMSKYQTLLPDEFAGTSESIKHAEGFNILPNNDGTFELQVMSSGKRKVEPIKITRNEALPFIGTRLDNTSDPNWVYKDQVRRNGGNSDAQYLQPVNNKDFRFEYYYQQNPVTQQLNPIIRYRWLGGDDTEEFQYLNGLMNTPMNSPRGVEEIMNGLGSMSKDEFLLELQRQGINVDKFKTKK